MLILGLLLFIISPLAGDVALRGLNFKLEGLMINTAATFVSLALLTGAYRLFGEEQTVTLLKQLVDIQKISKAISDIGLDNFTISRSNFDPKVIEADLFDSEEIFLVSRNFEVIKYKRVRDYFTQYLRKSNTFVKLIVSSNSTAIDKINDFETSLPNSSRGRFLVKKSEHLSCGMYGGDNCVYITLYLSHLTGDEAPALLCKKRMGKVSTLYSVYRNEFEELWQNAKDI
jgi:hypothetical protein